MKTISYVLLITALVALGNALPGKAANEVVLNAKQVNSARDIEAAIDTATDHGTRPGVVTLDGRQGRFEYTGDDRSINIYYSNVTLRSLNEAIISNCADGVFFDNVTAHNVTVEGLVFFCTGCGVAANNLGPHHHAVIRNNFFRTGSFPIEILQGDDWTITGNRLETHSDGIHLYETGGTTIRNNNIQAYVGVLLYHSGYDNTVSNNVITATWQGVVLSGKTLRNKVTANKMFHIQDAGIAFTDIVTWNQVTGNQVTCSPEAECVAVRADPINYEQNKIVGNKLMK